MLLSSGLFKEIDPLPDSGPGPKTLSRGDTTFGFFGEVDSSELIAPGDLVTTFLSSYSTFDVAPVTTKWLKFIVNGKVLFTPFVQACTNVSWNNLYDAGLVYGTGDNGLYPTATPTPQDKTITVGEDVFKIRLGTTANEDPTVDASGQYVSTTTQSELIMLFAALCRDVPSGKPTHIPSWNLYSSDTFEGIGGYIWGMNTIGADTTQTPRLMSVNLIQVSSSTKTTVARTHQWRPVLELVSK